jgi:hypothetical protein
MEVEGRIRPPCGRDAPSTNVGAEEAVRQCERDVGPDRQPNPVPSEHESYDPDQDDGRTEIVPQVIHLSIPSSGSSTARSEAPT